MVRIARLSLLLLATVFVATLQAIEPSEVAALRTKAEKGNGLAMYNLGLAYAQGDGVKSDLAEAFVWLSLAAENGATGKALDSVLGNITDAQLGEGRRRLTQVRTDLAARAASSAQNVVHRPTSRGFTLTTIPSTGTPAASTPTAKAAPPQVVSPLPRTTTSTEPLTSGQPVPDELARVKAELARANAKITELTATIARLQEEHPHRLPVTSAGAGGGRTTPPDGSAANR